MLKDSRSLCLDVCDYENHIVCNLFDNTADVSGQAHDVFVRTERNGWKELSFEIPSTCFTADGKEEENYRLQFLIADYRIRLKTETEVDWYLISEAKIIHDKRSKNVEVTAGHIAQLLKTKSLDLEFSDEEGNNIGTAEQILTTILEGTGWSVGNVADFYEDDGVKIKQRSMDASTNTGAFRLIENMCELFDAKPIYHGEGRTVDIVPMNPFSRELEPGEIPEEVFHDLDVLEIHYDKNMKNITRTVNTETLITRLYAYGSYGDENGMCSIQTCSHEEYTLSSRNYPAGKEFSFTDNDGAVYYFTTTDALTTNSKLIYSKLDFMSRSYVWNDTTRKAYHVYKKQNGTPTALTATMEVKKNYFPFLLNFDYYEKIGLLSEDMFQELAEYQQSMPYYYIQSENAAKEMIANEQLLSETLESNTGMLKLAVRSYGSQNGKLVLNLDTTQGDHGILYRTDYDEAKRNYFEWHVVKQLKDNGDPLSGIGSVVYIVHNTNPVTWDIAYVKSIMDDNGEIYTNDDGDPKDYDYGLEKTEPGSIALWLDRGNMVLSSDDRFYLFCSVSMSGRLSAKQVTDEAIVMSLKSEMTIATETHPTYFAERNDPQPSTSAVQGSYGWYYRFSSTTTDPGELYFCYGSRGENAWHRVYVQETMPTVVNDAYFFDLKGKGLYHGVSGQWVKMETAEDQRTAIQFSKVTYYCRQRDMIYHGLYEKYTYKAPSGMSAGNYAFKSPYEFFWCATTDRSIAQNNILTLDNVDGLLWQDSDIQHVVSTKVVSYDAAEFPVSNELTGLTYFPGKITTTNGVEEDSTGWYRTNNIKGYEQTVYHYSLPTNSYVVFYNINKVFKGYRIASGSGTFTTPGDTYYMRVITPSIPGSSHHLRVNEYSNYLYLSNKPYRIINIYGHEGELVGISPLMKKFADLADTVYEVNLAALNSAQDAIKNADNTLTQRLGDLLREGYWQEDRFVEGDEDRMYTDAMDNLNELAKPETTYDISYIDLYSANRNQSYAVDDQYDIDWPDIQITDAVHLVDPEIDINQWAYVDVINKCYDHPWDTTLEINTKLSLIDQHDFTDVLARIAEVANETKAKQSVYKRAAALSSSGTLASELLEGNIKANKALILGGSSNWYTDLKGNIVFETSDGSGAMMLTGYGILVASDRDSWGDWNWRTGITGKGFTADEVVTAFLSAKEALIGAITADMLHASVGQELEIGSNRALMLYATVSGDRPAGGLKTGLHNADGTYSEVGEGDSYIQIGAKETTGSGVNPAYINIMTGGQMNIYSGSDMNIKSGADLYIENQGHFEVKSGGDLKIASGGSIDIVASQAGKFTVTSPNFNVKANGDTDITGKITALTGEIAGFTVNYQENAQHQVVRRYMYAGGTNSMTSTAAGVYIGTDGINFGGGTFKVSRDGSTTYLKTTASSIFLGDIGSNGQTLYGKVSDMDQATDSAQQAADDAQAAADDAQAAADAAQQSANGAQATANTKSQTYRCTSAQIVTKAYQVGDMWIDTGSTYKWEYICNKVSNPKSASADWTLVSTAVTEGAALSIDAKAGNIDIAAANNITMAAGATLKIAAGKTLTLAVGNYTSGGITYSGNIKIGHGSKLFEIGCDETNAYIRHNRNTINTTDTNGIYIGTDGINVGKANGNYVKATADGTIDITGKITATSGAIGGISINSSYGIYTNSKTTATSTNTGFLIHKDGAIYLGAYDSETQACAFQVTSAGALTATNAKITGTITGSTITGGSINISSGTFKVDTSGKLTASNADISGKITATDGKIGAWSIGSKLIHASSSTSYVALDGSTDLYPLSGLSTPSDHMYAMWAGGESPNTAPFSVTKDGIVTISKLRIKKGDNSFQEVSLSDFTYTAASGDAYDWDKLFAKLRFQTVRSITQSTSTGQVTIKVSDNSGGTSSWTFNTATSVRLGDGSWSGSSTGSARAAYKPSVFYTLPGGSQYEFLTEERAYVTYAVGANLYIYGRYTNIPIEPAKVTLFSFDNRLSVGDWSSSWTSNAIIQIKESNSEYWQDLKTVSIDATDVWDMAAALTVPPSGSIEPGTTFTFKAPLKSSPNPGSYSRGQHSYEFRMTKTITPAATGVVNVIMGDSTKVGQVSIGDWYIAGNRAVDLATSWSQTMPYTGNSGNKLSVETTGRLSSDGSGSDDISRSWTFFTTHGDWPSSISRTSTCAIHTRIASTSGIIVSQSSVSASAPYDAGAASVSFSGTQSKNSQSSEPSGSFDYTLSETTIPAADTGRWIWFTVKLSNDKTAKIKLHVKKAT